jgi:hypothetical protein
MQMHETMGDKGNYSGAAFPLLGAGAELAESCARVTCDLHV